MQNNMSLAVLMNLDARRRLLFDMDRLRSSRSLKGRKMAGARALWRANGMKEEQFGRPVIAIVNSFTQFVPGHTHLHGIGQQIKARIEAAGCYAAEFDTVAIDDGIAMGHDGMLYSLPSRDLIADSIEYMCNAHCADAMICISNCDKVTPGMLMAAMRLNIPAVFVSGGPMEAGRIGNEDYDLVDIMVKGADPSFPDSELEELERKGCPTCGCCSGMFTANSMNCLSEALGMAPVGNGTVLSTHRKRYDLFMRGADLIVRNAKAYFSNTLSPGVVLRVSSNLVGEFPSAATYSRVQVAIPDNLCRKFSIMRSACNIMCADPRISPRSVPRVTFSPSFTSGMNTHSPPSDADL